MNLKNVFFIIFKLREIVLFVCKNDTFLLIKAQFVNLKLSIVKHANDKID